VRVKDLGTRPAPASLRELFSRMVRGRAPAIPVQRRVIPYWQERGWTRKGNSYSGQYQTRYAAFVGHVALRPGGGIDFYLYRPSRELQHGSHWQCFQHQGNDWYFVHMARRPKDVSSGILTIERLITEAYQS
jgi:hypothetical protein